MHCHKKDLILLVQTIHFNVWMSNMLINSTKDRLFEITYLFSHLIFENAGGLVLKGN